MEIVDENSPRAAGLSSASGKAKPRVSSGFPLAERSRDGQGIIGPAPPLRQKGSSGGIDGDREREREGHRRKSKSSRRLTADSAALADVLTNLDIDQDDGEAPVPSFSKKSKNHGQESRRLTADPLSINCLLNDSDSSTGIGIDGSPGGEGRDAALASSSMPMDLGSDDDNDDTGIDAERGSDASNRTDGVDVGSEGAIGDRSMDPSLDRFRSFFSDSSMNRSLEDRAASASADKTEDFSSLFGFTEMESPPPIIGEMGGDDRHVAGVRPRARHHSNQKPALEDIAPVPAAPPLLPSRPPGASARISGGGMRDSAGSKTRGPVSVKPQSPARRPRRSVASLDLSSREPSCRDPQEGGSLEGVPLSAAETAVGYGSRSGAGLDNQERVRGGAVEPTAMGKARGAAAKGEEDAMAEPSKHKSSRLSSRSLTADSFSVQNLLGSPLADAEDDDLEGVEQNAGGRRAARNTKNDPPPLDFNMEVGVFVGEGEQGTAGDDHGGQTADLNALYEMMNDTASDPDTVLTADQRVTHSSQAGGHRSPPRGSRFESVSFESAYGNLLPSSAGPSIRETAAAAAAAAADDSPSAAADDDSPSAAAAALRHEDRRNSGDTNSIISAVAGLLESPILGAFVGDEGTGKDAGTTTTPFGGPRNMTIAINHGQRGRDSGETARSECVLGLLESTPSPGGSGSVLDQSIADGSALKAQKTLAPVIHKVRETDATELAKPVSAMPDPAARRRTCAPGDFESIIGDLSPSGSSAPSDPTAERLEEMYPSSTPAPSSSPSARNFKISSSKSSAGSSSSLGDPVQSTTLTGKQRQPRVNDSSLAGDDANKKNKLDKRNRRATASPSSLNNLMEDLGLDAVALGKSGQDVDLPSSTNSHGGSSSSNSSPSLAPKGALEVPPPEVKTPSPPMVRRTQLKSPTRGQREIGDDTSSPRATAQKRTSEAVSPAKQPSNVDLRPTPQPESARGRLKSCLSSRKRTRGLQLVSAAFDAPAIGKPDTPDHGPSCAVGSPPAAMRDVVKTPGGPVQGALSGMSVQRDPVMETPRRVMFGAPMAAEFNHLSPSNRLTPMPSRAAKSLFPLEKQGAHDDDTDQEEDELTAANSAQLAEWERMDFAASPVEDFSSFDDGNESMEWGDGREDREGDGVPPVKASSSPGRRRRRGSLAPKSPLRRSIAAFSKDVRCGATSLDSDDSDLEDDAEYRAVDNLNASISVSGTTADRLGAVAAVADHGPDAHNLSFSITTTQMHGIADSDSSVELTGTFANPPEQAAASAAPAPACASDEDRGFDDATPDDSGMDLNDSCDLASTLCSASIREATSSPGMRRASTGSLLDLVSEVGEIEQEVLSQTQDNASDHHSAEDHGNQESDRSTDADTQEMLSPLTGANLSRPPSPISEAHPSSMDASPPEDCSVGAPSTARWAPVFGQPSQTDRKRLATVREETSPGRTSNSCPSPTMSIDASMAELHDDCLVDRKKNNNNNTTVKPALGVAEPARELSSDGVHDGGSGAMSSSSLPSSSRLSAGAAGLAGGARGRAIKKAKGRRRESVSSVGEDVTVALPASVEFADVGGDEGEGRVAESARELSSDGVRDGGSGAMSSSSLPLSSRLSAGAAGGGGRGRAIKKAKGRRRESVSSAGEDFTVALPASVEFADVGGDKGEGRVAESARELSSDGVRDGGSGAMSSSSLLSSSRLSAGTAGGGGRGRAIKKATGRRRESVSSAGEDVTVALPASVEFAYVGGDEGEGRVRAAVSSSSARYLRRRSSSIADVEMEGNDHVVEISPGADAADVFAGNVLASVDPLPSEREGYVDDASDGSEAGVDKVASELIKSRSSMTHGVTSEPAAVTAAAFRRPLVRRASVSAAATVGAAPKHSTVLPTSQRRASTTLSLTKESGVRRRASIAEAPTTANSAATTVGTAEGKQEGDAVDSTSTFPLVDAGDGRADSPPASSAFPTGEVGSVESLAPSVDNAATHGVSIPLRRRASSPLVSVSKKGKRSRGSVGVGGESRRASLQTVVGSFRRASVVPLQAAVGLAEGRGNTRRTSDAGGGGVGALRARLSSSDSVSSSVGLPRNSAVFARDELVLSDIAEERGRGEGEDDLEKEHLEHLEEENELEESVIPLTMNIEDLIRFVAPEMANMDEFPIQSVVVSPGSGSRDMEIPDGLLHALASTLNAASDEMEDKVAVVHEHAEAVVETAWRLHTDAPILAEIDHAIATRAVGDGKAMGMVRRVRDMAKQIKSNLVTEWKAWEVEVMTRLNIEAEKALAQVSKTGSASTARGNQIEEMISQTDWARRSIKREESRASIRSRIEKTEAALAQTRSEIGSLETELEALRKLKEEAARKKVVLKEGKSRRQERTNAADKRRGSVVELMDLETKSIQLEREALAWNEKLKMQMGLMLWSRPVKLLPHEVVLSYAAPHDSTLHHQLHFALSDRSCVRANAVTLRQTSLPSDATARSSRSAAVTVGNERSASGRLSRLIFEEGEGRCGLFSGGECPGAAISGLRVVENVVDMRDHLQIADWYVGRAYCLLQELHHLEKKYACTVMQHPEVYGLPASRAMLCVEIANWRTRITLRLRFRVATSFGCCIGRPEVEVDVGALKARAVDTAIRKAGGDRAGAFALTKAVRAAAACINGDG